MKMTMVNSGLKGLNTKHNNCILSMKHVFIATSLYSDQAHLFICHYIISLKLDNYNLFLIGIQKKNIL